MAARLRRLRTKPERLREEQAAALRQLMLAFPGLPERSVGNIIAAIDRETAAKNGWTFVMLSPAQNEAVVAWLLEKSSRPQKAVRLWAALFGHLRRDTGEIMLTRDELAEMIDDRPDKVSAIMSELESIGAISRRREKVAGMRGPGVVRYFMNPNVATHLTGKARDQAQAKAELLQLMVVEPVD
jgi:hypothetical protein